MVVVAGTMVVVVGTMVVVVGTMVVAMVEVVDVDGQVADARGFLAAEADSTRSNYATDWRAFTAWCAGHGFESLPADPKVVALYLTNYARDHKASTVVLRAVGIAKGHRGAGHLSPTEHESVRLLLAGIRRTKGMAPNPEGPRSTRKH